MITKLGKYVVMVLAGLRTIHRLFHVFPTLDVPGRVRERRRSGPESPDPSIHGGAKTGPTSESKNSKTC